MLALTLYDRLVARRSFSRFLHQLGYRLSHVLRQMLPIAMHLLQKDGAYQ